jgi:hypothetical protein
MTRRLAHGPSHAPPILGCLPLQLEHFGSPLSLESSQGLVPLPEVEFPRNFQPIKLKNLVLHVLLNLRLDFRNHQRILSLGLSQGLEALLRIDLLVSCELLLELLLPACLLASTTLELVSNTSITLSSNLTSFETVQEMAELVAAGDSNN